MAHTRSQDLEARFNTLQSNFTKTQQEVRQLSANISTINKTMHFSIATSIAELKQDLKQDMTTQLEFVSSMICTKLHIPIIFIPITFSVTYAFRGWMLLK
jgi:wobble nucleotide-excising tRNase